MTLYFMDDEGIELLSSVMEKESTVDREKIEAFAGAAVPIDLKKGAATINVQGMMVPKRNGLLDYLGVAHTAYADIIEQTAQAVSLGAKNITYNINSGGGTVEGMLTAMKAVKAAPVPTAAKVTGKAASAAYMLAAQTDSIIATEETDLIGSIGVAAKISKDGFVKNISNTASPNKRPDVATEEGVAAVQAELDDVFNAVMPYVVSGRNTTLEEAAENWGKGGVMTAKTAITKGMIDGIGAIDFKQQVKNTGSSGLTEGKKIMNRDELKTNHPELFNAIFNDGVKAGKEEFQELAAAHIMLAQSSGAMDRALEDIKSMKAVTPSVFAFHNAEGMKKAQIEAREEEAPAEVPPGEQHAEEKEEAPADAFAESGFEVSND